MQDFKNLGVWQKAHALSLDMYRITESFPKYEIYGLTSQIRRSCSSIPANIAEGCGRDGDTEFGRYLQIALGSVYEVEYHLILSHDLKFVKDEDFGKLNNQINEIRKMLIALKGRLKK